VKCWIICAPPQPRQVMVSLIGQGYQRHHYAAGDPAQFEKPAPGTRPYGLTQPEISQGRLEALLNFQTQWSRISRSRHRHHMPRCLMSKQPRQKAHGQIAERASNQKAKAFLSIIIATRKPLT